MDTDKLGQVIYEKALACGFDDCGIIPIDDMDGFQQRLQEREEKVPSSAFFYQGMGDFANLKKRFPWAKSVIIGTYWLGKYRFPPSLQGKYGKAFSCRPVIVSVRRVSLRAETLKRGLRSRESAVKEGTNLVIPALVSCDMRP